MVIRSSDVQIGFDFFLNLEPDKVVMEQCPFLLSYVMEIDELGSLGISSQDKSFQVRETSLALAPVGATLSSFQEFLSSDPVRLQVDLSEHICVHFFSSLMLCAWQP